MIDQNGNKIIDKTNEKNNDFLLAELRFTMKGFRKDSDDTKALLLAERLNELLKSGEKAENIMEILSELESYSQRSRSDDFLWKLVYIRRSIADSQGKSTEDLSYAAECRHMSAEFFEKICEIEPTLHNRCCRVMEYVSAVLYYWDIKDQMGSMEIISRLFARAEELFRQIEDSTENIYYRAGKFLYLTKYEYDTNLENGSDEKFRVVKQLSRFARDFYMLERNFANLRFLAKTYVAYSSFKQFSYQDEGEHLKTVIAYVEENVSSGNNSLSETLRKLKDALNKFNCG